MGNTDFYAAFYRLYRHIINDAVTLPYIFSALLYVNINGHLIPHSQASLPVGNTAFRYGAGLFETIRVSNGAINLEQYHWDRLLNGLAQLQWPVPSLLTRQVLTAQVLRTVKKNAMEHLCRVRLQVYGGNGGIFGPDSNELNYIIECFPLTESDISFNDNGLILGIAAGLRKSPDTLANLKSCNALLYTTAGRQAKQHRWNDALICNTGGNIIESVIANIFWVKDNQIYTPPLTEGCVAGVMRRHLLATIPGITETPLSTHELMQAHEVFLTNAIKGIRWVKAIDNATYHSSRASRLHASLCQ